MYVGLVSTPKSPPHTRTINKNVVFLGGSGMGGGRKQNLILAVRSLKRGGACTCHIYLTCAYETVELSLVLQYNKLYRRIAANILSNGRMR